MEHYDLTYYATRYECEIEITELAVASRHPSLEAALSAAARKEGPARIRTSTGHRIRSIAEYGRNQAGELRETRRIDLPAIDSYSIELTSENSATRADIPAIGEKEARQIVEQLKNRALGGQFPKGSWRITLMHGSAAEKKAQHQKTGQHHLNTILSIAICA